MQKSVTSGSGELVGTSQLMGGGGGALDASEIARTMATEIRRSARSMFGGDLETLAKLWQGLATEIEEMDPEIMAPVSFFTSPFFFPSFFFYIFHISFHFTYPVYLFGAIFQSVNKKTHVYCLSVRRGVHGSAIRAVSQLVQGASKAQFSQP